MVNQRQNFFSIFKRGVVVTYHHMSAAHLHRYCAEFDFLYNIREITATERADQPFPVSTASASCNGGLIRSQSKIYEPPRQIGEPRKRWTKN